MANKPLQSIKFPDLPDTYTVPVVDSTLAVSGAAADAKKTGDKLAKKVDAVSGKGLSTNDFTTTEKNKLSGIESGANKTVIDSTLAISGNAADAKAVGDALADVDRNAYGAYIVPTATGPIAHFEDGADSIPMKDVLVHIEPVQAGSGDPSPENVRPITGWTGAKVTRAGKNLLPYPYSDTTKEVNGITFTDNGDGTITANGTATASAQFILTGPMLNKDYLGCILNGRQGTVANGTRICAQVRGEPWTMFANDYGSGAVITDSGYEQIRFIIVVDKEKTCDNLVFRPMLCAPNDTDGTYTPFVKQDVYNITFPTSAGTVYGGTLDVTSGVLTVDREIVVFTGASSENWQHEEGSYGVREKIRIDRALNPSGRTFVSSNVGIFKSSNDVGTIFLSSGRIIYYYPPTTITSDAQFKEWLASNNMQVVYPLPDTYIKTYQLTPQEITSLLGTNNLWTDAGNSEVEYRADAKMYITKKITEAVSALS